MRDEAETGGTSDDRDDREDTEETDDAGDKDCRDRVEDDGVEEDMVVDMDIVFAHKCAFINWKIIIYSSSSR